MSDTSFQFKEFTVDQDKCSMKIGTDGVLLGAWAPVHNRSCVLDIGTGTGLLALMMAQRFPDAIIEAVEIDPLAAVQAKSNFEVSKWSSRITLYATALQDFEPLFSYDFIICNPPYFTNSLLSPDSERNVARHNHALPFGELLSFIGAYLNGYAACIIPMSERMSFVQLISKNGLYLTKETQVISKAGKEATRTMLLLSNKPSNYSLETLTILDVQGKYTPEFLHLTQAFYLHL